MVANSKDIAIEFAQASKKKNVEQLITLLSKNGLFQIQDKKFETVIVKRQRFLTWYEGKLRSVKINSIRYDQCTSCVKGQPVILFNNGKFPRTVKDSSEACMTGLALKIEKDKISEIAFCFNFLKYENKYVFQVTGEKIKKYIDEDNLSQEEAIATALGEEKKEFDF